VKIKGLLSDSSERRGGFCWIETSLFSYSRCAGPSTLGNSSIVSYPSIDLRDHFQLAYICFGAAIVARVLIFFNI
jgi:hypothetical protein